jgi:outer membrane lipoprotein-sorting protein
LKPIKGTRFASKYDQMDAWVDLRSHFPIRIQLTAPESSQVQTIDLSTPSVNASLKDSDFKLPPPGKDWSVSNEALGD